MNSAIYLRLISFFQLEKINKSFLLMLFLILSSWNLVLAQALENTLDFDGTNDYVNLGTTLSFPNTTALTIEACVNRKIVSVGMVVSEHNAGVAGHYDFMVNTDVIISFSREVVPWWFANTAATGLTGNWTAPSISNDTNHILSI